MMDKINEYLKELEFDTVENCVDLPTLKDVMKRFRDLAKLKHSDKGGDDADFVKLYYAYNQIKKCYREMEGEEKQKYCEGKDEEEDLIKNLFEEFNLSRKNKSCFTIFIENEMSLMWDEILENTYGKPDDKGINGKHWSHKGYEFEDLEKSDIYIRKYHKPKSDNTSKIVIQGNFELSIAFVAKEMPKLYKKVYDKKRIAISVQTQSCEECGYKAATLAEFNEHVHDNHSETVIANSETQPIFKCSRCDLEVLNEVELKKHAKKSHKKCDHCPFQTTKLTTLKPHIWIRSMVDQYVARSVTFL